MSLSDNSDSKPPMTTTTVHVTSLPEAFKKQSTLLTRTKKFKQLARWAYGVCDANGTGRIGKSELYAGILLVHLKLAKHFGAAACYPPTRQVVDDLFDASDDDHNGYIDEQEFRHILVICCAQITSRIAAYFLIIILLVPYMAKGAIDLTLSLDRLFEWKLVENLGVFGWVKKLLTVGEIAEKMVSCVLLFLVIPLLFNYIDKSSRDTAEIVVADDIKDDEKSD